MAGERATMTDVLTVKQAANLSGFCVKTVRRAIKAKRLAASQPNGGRYRITRAALAAWLLSSPVDDRPSPSPPPAVLPIRVRPYRPVLLKT